MWFSISRRRKTRGKIEEEEREVGKEGGRESGQDKGLLWDEVR